MLDETSHPPIKILQPLQNAEKIQLSPIVIDYVPQQYKVPVALESTNEAYEWNPYMFQLQPANPLTPTELEQMWTTNSGTSSSSQARNAGSGKPTRKYYKGPPICQACKCDLKNLKEYYRRYRVCDKCQKADHVVIDRANMRYCQQCGRFQQLQEFSGSRRSCRARLELHNARRRKTPPTNNNNNNNTANTNTSNAQDAQNVQVSGGFQGTLMRAGQDLLNTDFLNMNDEFKMMRDPAVVAFERKPDSAIGISGFGNPSVQMMLNDMTPLRLSRSRDSGGSAYQANIENKPSKPEDLIFLPSVSDVLAPELPSSSVQMSFLTSELLNDDFPNIEDPLPKMTGNNQQSLHAQNVISSNAQMHIQAPQQHQLEQQLAANIDTTDDFMVELQQVLGSSPVPTPNLPPNAIQLESDNQPGASFLFPDNYRYDGFNKLSNLTMKLFELQPHEIPWGLKEHLHVAINMGIVVEAFLRPGCIHFSADGIVSVDQNEETTAEQVAERLLGQGILNMQNAAMLINVNGTQVMIRNGEIVQDEGLEQDPIILSEVDKPIACKGDEIIVRGSNLEGTELLLRQNGLYFNYDIIEVTNEYFKIIIPQDVNVGLLKIQALSGPNFSQVLSCTIVGNQIMEEVGDLSKSQQEAMSIDLGLVLELSDHIRGKLIEGNNGRRQYSVDDIKSLVPIARSLFGFSVVKGLATLANAIILPASMCCYSGQQFSDAIAWTTTSRLPLLFMAVQSRNPQIVGVLSCWAQWLGYVGDRGYNLWVVAGPHQLTALHLSALLEDDGRMATALVDLCVHGMDVMRSAKTSAGLNPFEFALQYGSEGVRAGFSRLVQRQNLMHDNNLGRHDTAHMSRTITSISEDTSISPFENHSIQGESFYQEEDDQDNNSGDMHSLFLGESLRISSNRRNTDVVADSATQIELAQDSTKSKSLDDTQIQQ